MKQLRSPGIASTAVLMLIFAASRLLYHAAGVRFDDSTLPWYWQFLDVEILRGDLLRGVYYQHSQPPLFNLFLGFGLKLGGDASAVWFQTSFLALGLALTLALHALMRRLGVAPLPALLAAVFFAVSPSAILYENSLFYTYPVAVIMGLAALAFARFASRGRTIDAALLFSLLAAAALTRSIFHLAWLLLAVGFVVLVHPGSRRRLVGIALLPVLLASAVYAKNWVHFGSFSASSWVGMSLAKLTTSTVSLSERRRLHSEGRISEISLIQTFSPLPLYPLAFRNPPGPRTDGLRRAFRSTGPPNYNHIAYVAIAQHYLRDALTMIGAFPGHYLQRVGKAYLFFLSPPSHSSFFGDNRSAVAKIERGYDILYGVPHAWRGPPTDLHPASTRFLVGDASWLWLLVVASATAYGLFAGVRTRRGRGDRARDLTLLFLSANVLWVILVGNSLEIGENNRFRMATDPLVLALAMACLSDLRLRRPGTHRS